MEHGLSGLIWKTKAWNCLFFILGCDKWLNDSESPFSLQYRDNTPSIPTSERYSKRPFKWNGIREGFEKHQEAHKSLGQGASSLALKQESWREAAQ